MTAQEIMGSVGAGVGGLASGVGGGLLGELFAGRAHERNREFVQRSENFRREMDSTAYQRSVADMRAAGLNPMMMYKGMSPVSGSSGPTAAGAMASPVPLPNPAMTGMEFAKSNSARLLDNSGVTANLAKAFADTGRGKVQNVIGDVLVDVSKLVRSNADTARKLDAWLDKQAEGFGGALTKGRKHRKDPLVNMLKSLPFPVGNIVDWATK